MNSKLCASLVIALLSSSHAYARVSDSDSDPVEISNTHVQLEFSKPGSNEKLDASPKQIVLRFSEEMNYKESTIVVYSRIGNRMNEGKVIQTSKGKTTIATILRKPLPKGLYVVRWAAACLTPGHLPIDGNFNFAIK